MGSWSCPHDLAGKCTRVNNLPCDPGMKGCVLFGRFVWADESKNRKPRPARGGAAAAPQQEDDNDAGGGKPSG